MSCFKYDYSEISKMAKIGLLKSFRIQPDLFFFYKVVNLTFDYLIDNIQYLLYNINTFDSTFKIYDLNKISFIDGSSLSAESIKDKIHNIFITSISRFKFFIRKISSDLLLLLIYFRFYIFIFDIFFDCFCSVYIYNNFIEQQQYIT